MRTNRLIKANRILLACVFAVAAADATSAEDTTVYPDALDKYKPTEKDIWKESQITLPPYPLDRNLISVPLPERDSLKIYIDEKSISLLPDRVIRFSLVVESPFGARNVFYDAIHCETKEYKTYAFGTTESTFQLVKNPKWREIPYYPSNAYRYHLYEYVVCDENQSPLSPRELVRVIKYAP
ncbi:MAG: hypothetical protein BMS9Abin22_131 [Gammaproteobacteria bacterium]|nr:MAG: hypothetical protein BMS9Abin22_131 [Gammaproteobacteria bacterium]